jgi:hypothetical protein
MTGHPANRGRAISPIHQFTNQPFNPFARSLTTGCKLLAADKSVGVQSGDGKVSVRELMTLAIANKLTDVHGFKGEIDLHV